MQKIRFGYATEMNPAGSWEGIGIAPNYAVNSADYYGAINCNDCHYVVAKIDESEFNNRPESTNKFVVRPALVDLFPDGSNILFLDLEQSSDGKAIEDYLNNPSVLSNIQNINDVLNYCKDIANVHMANRAFELLKLDNEISATSINHEMFMLKNQCIMNCHKSVSEIIYENDRSISR